MGWEGGLLFLQYLSWLTQVLTPQKSSDVQLHLLLPVYFSKLFVKSKVRFCYTLSLWHFNLPLYCVLFDYFVFEISSYWSHISYLNMYVWRVMYSWWIFFSSPGLGYIFWIDFFPPLYRAFSFYSWLAWITWFDIESRWLLETHPILSKTQLSSHQNYTLRMWVAYCPLFCSLRAWERLGLHAMFIIWPGTCTFLRSY